MDPQLSTESENCVFEIQKDLSRASQDFQKFSGPNPSIASGHGNESS